MVVEYSDWTVDVVLYETLENRSVHFSEKLSGVNFILGNNNKAVVIHDVAFEVIRAALSAISANIVTMLLNSTDVMRKELD